ncbi:MAG: SusC/RagA family TonB-linked outer membrane protein [Chitinophagaceae bacterium]|nr:SusC/RagA family TonB-linked outer membrane protein [Chitinophagaceae bacterium]
MQLTALLLTVCCLSVTAKTISQSITYSGKDVKLSTVFDVVRNQTGLFVLYNAEQVDDTKKITVDAKDVPLRDFLNKILVNERLSFSIDNKTILIKAVTPTPNLSQGMGEQDFSDATPIKGVIRDSDGNPLGGINIVIKGTKRGVVTDAYGNFMIDAKEGEVLVISSVSYAAREIKIGASDAPIIVSLEKNISQLDEVQYIAYGTQNKRYSVGNVSSVKAADIEKQPVQNPLFALQGRVPGLLVTQNTGLANGAFTVRIQGQNSINQKSDPLIVVDGVPLAFEMFGDNVGPLRNSEGRSGNSPINFINPADIEAIDVLKDADATAIYGSRAANGAILITTKKGKVGKTSLSLGLQEGWGKVTRKVDMLNTRQYLDMRYEALRNDGMSISSGPNYDLRLWDTTKYTDWQKELIGGTARYTNINVSVSGGSSAFQYLVGGTLNRITTVFPSDFPSKTGGLHFNITSTSTNQRFKLSLTGSYSVNNNGVPGEDITMYALLLAPNSPSIYNEDGTLNWAPNENGSSTRHNPLAYTQYQAFDYSAKTLTSNAIVSYLIFPGLTVKSSFGYNNIQGNSFRSYSANGVAPEARSNYLRSSNFSNTNTFSWIAEPQTTFTRTIGGINVDALAGGTFQKNFAENINVGASGFLNDLLIRDLRSATSMAGAYNNTIYRYNAVFGRVNLLYDKKYIVTLTARRDGSSRFGEKSLFNNFWSAAAGWIFTEEKTIANALSFLSFGKLRSSYGTTGNDGIGDYQYLNNYEATRSGISYQGTTGLWTSGLGNPYLEWEETRKLMVGIDLGFLKDRVLLNVTGQRNRSSNQLLGYPLSTFTGFSGITRNLPATIQNISLEFSLVTNNIKAKNFTWTTNFNLTIPRNKLIAYPDIEESSYANGRDGVIIGQPLGAKPYYHYMGIDPGVGFYTLANEFKQPALGLPMEEARNVIVSTQPAFYGGLINTLSYRGFSIDFLLQFVRQKGPKELYYWSGLTMPGSLDDLGRSNQPLSVINRWQKPGNSSIQRFQSGPGFPAVAETDANFSWDASYVRLKNVSLSWQIPNIWSQKIHLQSGSVYFRGQNLATITRYSGLDPETQNSTTLPPLELWTAGITIVL